MDVLRDLDHWHVYPLGYHPIRLTELLHVCTGGFLWTFTCHSFWVAVVLWWYLDYVQSTYTIPEIVHENWWQELLPFLFAGVFLSSAMWAFQHWQDAELDLIPGAPGFQWQMSRFRLGFMSSWWWVMRLHPGWGRWKRSVWILEMLPLRWLLGEKLIAAVPGWIFGSMKTFGFFFWKFRSFDIGGKQIGVFCWW